MVLLICCLVWVVCLSLLVACVCGVLAWFVLVGCCLLEALFRYMLLGRFAASYLCWFT